MSNQEKTSRRRRRLFKNNVQAKQDSPRQALFFALPKLPSLRPLILFVLAIRTMDAFRFFDSIYVLTSGGPGTATETITLYTYALAFRLLEIGKASALGVLTLLIVSAIVAVMIAVIYRRDKGAF